MRERNAETAVTWTWHIFWLTHFPWDNPAKRTLKDNGKRKFLPQRRAPATRAIQENCQLTLFLFTYRRAHAATSAGMFPDSHACVCTFILQSWCLKKARRLFFFPPLNTENPSLEIISEKQGEWSIMYRGKSNSWLFQLLHPVFLFPYPCYIYLFSAITIFKCRAH